MADVKISGLPSDSALDSNHYVPVNDPTGPATKRTLLSTLASYFFTQANIPTGAGSPITRDSEQLYPFAASGLLWSADSLNSTRNGSMTSGLYYINGLRLSLSAVTARSFTASKDTWVIIDDAGVITYTETTNGGTPPTLASNQMFLAMIVTSAGAITKVFHMAARNPRELCRVKLAQGVSDSLIALFTAKRYLKFSINYFSTGGTVDGNLRFNGDSGNSYAVFFAGIGTTPPTTGATQNAMIITGATTVVNQFVVGDVLNVAGREKVVRYDRLEGNTAGAGTAPNYSLFAAKWANTSVQASRLDLLNLGGTGDFAADSEIVIFGND